MKSKLFVCTVMCSLVFSISATAQNYFYKDYAPFNDAIPSPEKFLGYGIGEQHTRHDRIVAYLEALAESSPMATLYDYGKTHEQRRLVILTISSIENQNNLESIKQAHLRFTDPADNPSNYDDVPVFVQLGYNVHGNEPSSSEAAMLTAYTLLASEHPEVVEYRKNAVIFVDPTINPDGRDRHTQWANQFKANELVSDGSDAEHNETWPGGRTNHYWFDLNRDWFLAVNPESQSKLKWYHEWYPNVVTDFHEMGTNSNYFFEPMKPIGSQDPIMPKENYEDLNDLFAPYYAKALDRIGSFYYTKESFDGTYPGYGSSYPDLQGALALLFEQASSRGHIQDTHYGKITFAFTIRNQYTSSMATVKAAAENIGTLRKYQQDFFKSAVSKTPKTGFASYEFGDSHDANKTKDFIDKLLMHKIKVYKKGNAYSVPLKQPQQRMVQSVFETYSKYRDSVFYDASAWSLANFFNMPYRGTRNTSVGAEITDTKAMVTNRPVQKSAYAYLMNWNDYYTPAALYFLQKKGIKVAAAFKPFTAATPTGNQSFNYGTLMIPVSKQKKSADEVFALVSKAQQKFNIPVVEVNTGFNIKGIDLGSNNFRALQKPKIALLIGQGVSSYEAGEVWHLLDNRIPVPLTKIQMRSFRSANLDKYNTLVMVSGSYTQLDSIQQQRIKTWVSKGNTLVTIARGTQWAINKKLVKEKLVTLKKDAKEKKEKEVKRLPYVTASEERGRERLGGVILQTELDLTHPLSFGYQRALLPVYKNNTVFMAPSKSPYSTVADYTDNAHIDGYISEKNRSEFIPKAASLIVSPIGRGRVVLFADNPNFRGAWQGTNRLFLNALFLGNHISVPGTAN